MISETIEVVSVVSFSLLPSILSVGSERLCFGTKRLAVRFFCGLSDKN